MPDSEKKIPKIKKAPPLKISTIQQVKKQKLEKQTQKIMQLKTAIAKNFWDLGNCLEQVNQGELYLADGHESFAAYLSAVKISRSAAYRFMEIARNFSRETAARFGKYKLYYAIAYSEATPQKDLPLDITRLEIEVKTPTGKITKKPFEKATTKEIKKALSNLRRKNTIAMSAIKRAPRDSFQLFLKRAQERLRGEIKLQGTLKTKAEVSLSLDNVPYTKLGEVLQLLKDAYEKTVLSS